MRILRSKRELPVFEGAILLSFFLASCTKPLPSLLSERPSVFALGLVPMRALFVPPAMKLFNDDASRIENAIRLSYGIVSCSGADGANSLKSLRSAASHSSDAVQRMGASVGYSMDGKSAVDSGCKLMGSHLMSVGSFAQIFGQAPASQDQFETQQAIWLALRGATPIRDGSYMTTLSQFLSENFGAYPTSGSSNMIGSFNQLDAQFNPCVSSSGGSFNKTASFSCAAGSIPVPKDQNALSAKLQKAIGDGEEASLAALSAKKSTAPQDDGWQVASRTDLSMKDLKQSGVVPPQRLKLSITLDSSTQPKIDDPAYHMSEIVANSKAGIESRFGITFGPAPAPVISKNNPRQLPLPPDLQISGNQGIAGPGGALYYPNVTIDSNAKMQANWQLWKLDDSKNQWTLLNSPGLPPLKAQAKTALALTQQRAGATAERVSCDGLGQVLCLAQGAACQWQSPASRCAPGEAGRAASGAAAGLYLDAPTSAAQPMMFSSDLQGVNQFLNWTSIGNNDVGKNDTSWINGYHNCQGFANTLGTSAVASGAADSANLVAFKGYDADGNYSGHELSQLNMADGTSVLVEPNAANGSAVSAPYKTPTDGQTVPDDIVQNFVATQSNLAGDTNISQRSPERQLGDTNDSNERALNSSQGFQDDMQRLGYTPDDINQMQQANDETRATAQQARTGDGGLNSDYSDDYNNGTTNNANASDPGSSTDGSDSSDQSAYDQSVFDNGSANLNPSSSSGDASGDSSADNSADNSADSSATTTDNSSGTSSNDSNWLSEIFGNGANTDSSGDSGSSDTSGWDSSSDGSYGDTGWSASSDSSDS